MVVARLTKVAVAKATRTQVTRSAVCSRGVTIIRLEPRRSMLEQGEVSPTVGWKPEEVLRSKWSHDLSIVAINQSSLAIASSFRNIPQYNPA